MKRALAFGDLRFLFGLIFFATGIFSQTFAEDKWLLLPEPKFMGHKISIPLANAKATVLAPAKITGEEVEFPREADWKSTGLEIAAVQSATALEADQLLETLTPELVRDSKKVVLYGVLRSQNPPASMLLLAQGFLAKFQDVFGGKLKVVVPNRYTVIIFPELMEDYTLYAPEVIEEWRSRAPKVSLEVFQFGKDGPRAVGTFEEP